MASQARALLAGRLQSKVAIVTGASRGIGRSIAERFAQQGARVVVTDVLTEEGQQTVQAINKSIGSEVALFMQHDVSKLDQWTRVFEAAEKNFGGLDILVNNAGIADMKAIEDMSEADWDRMLGVNLKGTFLGCKGAVKLMRRQGRGGSIINMSSIAGMVGFPQLSHYCASKGGIRTFTKALALEVGKDKIRVNSIHPGVIDTQMVSGVMDEEQVKKITGSTPLGTIGKPEDIANIALYLASDESKFATGAEFVVDAGYLAQ